MLQTEGSTLKRQTGLWADPFLRSYVTTICHLLTPLVGRKTIDISAGSAWVKALGFTDYTPVDVTGEYDYWDINTALPDHHAGNYDLAICMGSLHYSTNPHESLAQILRTLAPNGDFVLMVPWLYPPHDREIDRWRIAPRQIHSMVADSFDEVDIYNVGSLWHAPLHIAKRWVSGPFLGLTPRQLMKCRHRRAVSAIRVASADDLDVAWTGPLNVVVHARGYREPHS